MSSIHDPLTEQALRESLPKINDPINRASNTVGALETLLDTVDPETIVTGSEFLDGCTNLSPIAIRDTFRIIAAVCLEQTEQVRAVTQNLWLRADKGDPRDVKDQVTALLTTLSEVIDALNRVATAMKEIDPILKGPFWSSGENVSRAEAQAAVNHEDPPTEALSRIQEGIEWAHIAASRIAEARDHYHELRTPFQSPADIETGTTAQ